MIKKVFEYRTGQEIPDGAIYLNTIKKTREITRNALGKDIEIPCWYVWHYFLVEV